MVLDILYPSWFDGDEENNPYQSAISEIGIGAFPLLPNSNNNWLKEFLVDQFGIVDKLDDAIRLNLSTIFMCKNLFVFLIQECPFQNIRTYL